MDAFLASLNLRTEILPLGPASAERAAQLTERTNQHNACKSPVASAALRALAKSHLCFTG